MNAPRPASLPAQRLSALQIAIACVVTLAMIADGLDMQLLSLVAPVILKEWQVARASFGPALSAALVGMSLGAGIGGWLGDRLGRKRVLLGAVLWFGVGTILASYTHSVFEMTVLRVLGGIGFGAATPNATALANEWLPLRWRPRITSILTMGTPLGGMIGAVAVPQVLPVLGWRGSFVVCGVVSLLLAIVVGLVVRESPEFTPRKTRMPTGSSSGVFARENRRVNIGTWTCFFCYTVVAYAVAAWAPVFLTTAGMALPEALHSVLIFNICAVVTAITAGFVVMRIGSKWMIGVCSALLLAAITVLLFALQPQGVVTAPRFTLVPIAFGVIGATTGTTLALLATILALAYPPAYRATGIGIGAMIGRCGGILIALTGGAILSLRGDDPTPLFLTLLVATVIAFVAMLVIDRHVPASSGIH